MENTVLEKLLIEDVLVSADSKNQLRDEEEMEIIRLELKESIDSMCNTMRKRNQFSEEEAVREIRAKSNFSFLVAEVKQNMLLMQNFRA